MTTLYKTLLLVIVFFSTFSSITIAQLIVTTKKEIELDVNKNKTGIVSTGVNGIVLLKEQVTKRGDSKKSITLELLDNRLSSKAEVKLAVPVKSDLVNYFSKNDYLYLVYSSISSELVNAFKIDLRDLKIQQSDFYSLPQVRYYEAEVINDKLFIAGVKGKKGLLLQLDFKDNRSKIIQIQQHNFPAFIQNLEVINDQLYASIKSSNAKDSDLYYQIFNNAGSTVEKGTVTVPKGNKILEGHFAQTSSGEINLFGTYSLKRSVHPLGVFNLQLGREASFYPFENVEALSDFKIVNKSTGKKEAKDYLKINKVEIKNGKLIALAESYDIVQEKKAETQEQYLLDPNTSFLKMWPVNNMNYHDYNIHIFQKRLEEVAAYSFKSAITLVLEKEELTVSTLDISDETQHKSFGRLLSHKDEEGNLSVINKLNGEVRKIDPMYPDNVQHTKHMIDRDGNPLSVEIAGAYFWQKHQYLHYSIAEKGKGKYLLTLLKVKE